MLELKGKDAAIMVISSDGSRGSSPPCLPVRDIYARRLSFFDTKPTVMQNKERHMSFCSHPP